MKIYVTKTILFLLIALFLTSCSSYFGQDGRRGVSSSLVDYLYPDGQVPPEHEETTPHLRLPLTVGLAFVPPGQQLSRSLPEAQKTFLLEKVKKKIIKIKNKIILGLSLKVTKKFKATSPKPSQAKVQANALEAEITNNAIEVVIDALKRILPKSEILIFL